MKKRSDRTILVGLNINVVIESKHHKQEIGVVKFNQKVATDANLFFDHLKITSHCNKIIELQGLLNRDFDIILQIFGVEKSRFFKKYSVFFLISSVFKISLVLS